MGKPSSKSSVEMRLSNNIIKSVYNKYKWIILFLIGSVIFAPFITNDVPIYCVSKQGYSLPIFNKTRYQSELINNINPCINSISPIIPYAANTLNTKERLLPPLSGHHILGTDSLGRDIFAGMLYGIRPALLIAFMPMLIAGLGGIIIGSFAGYFGNKSIRISRFELIVQFVLASLYIFITFGILKYLIGFNYLYIILLILILFGQFYFIHSLMASKFRSNLYLPIDHTIMRSIEIVKSIPALFLLLALLGYLEETNIFSISIIIGFLVLPNTTRLVRGEIINVKSSDFVTSSTILNFSHTKILFQQILPNIIGPLCVALSFGAAGAILIESSLSFLGIGLGIEEVTWGSILTESRKYHSAWWLAVVPGLGIFSLILFFNRIGQHISSLYRSDSTGL